MENIDFNQMASFIKEMDDDKLTLKDKIVRAYNKKANEIGKEQLDQNLKELGINVFLFLSFATLIKPTAKLLNSFK